MERFIIYLQPDQEMTVCILLEKLYPDYIFLQDMKIFQQLMYPNSFCSEQVITMKLLLRKNHTGLEPPETLVQTLVHRIMGKQRIQEICQEFGLTEQEETILDELLIALENSINSDEITEFVSVYDSINLSIIRKFIVAGVFLSIVKEYQLITKSQ